MLLLDEESRLALDEFVPLLLRCGGLGGEVAGAGEDESDGGVAASTSAAKLSVSCAGSGRVDFAAVAW